jgi:hypothetical protein
MHDGCEGKETSHFVGFFIEPLYVFTQIHQSATLAIDCTAALGAKSAANTSG